MTDVIEIARSRRSRLVAEVARLDDFISMAETLLRLEDDPPSGRGWLTDMMGPDGSMSDAVAEAGRDREDVKARDGAEESGVKAEADSGALDTGTLDRGALDPGSLDSGHAGHNFFAPRPARNEDELVIGAEDPASQADEEAGLDAAIGQKLRQRRWMMGMTKRQLAEKLGIDVAEIQNFERGLAQIGASRMWELAEALDVSASYFFEEAAQSSSEADETRVERTLATVPAPARAVALARTA